MVLAMRKKSNALRRWQWRASMLCLGVIGILLMVKLHGMMLPQDEDETTPFVATHLSSSSRPKLAFLFLARNRMPLDFLWEHFFRGAEGDDFSVYIHARPGYVFGKATTNCHFFYDRQIKNSILVEWGEASMIEAEQILLSTALEDPTNQRFVLLSDSCIPLYNFSYTYDYIMSSNRSFLDSFVDKKDKQYNLKMSPTIPKAAWRKGSQWFVLIRKHAEMVVADTTVFQVFSKHCKRTPLPEFWRESDMITLRKNLTTANCIPDEHYIQTLVAMNGSDNELERRTLTYSLWKVSDKGRQGWHPVTFNFADASLKVIKDIQAIDRVNYQSETRTEWCSSNDVPRPCYLFARKFTRGAGVRLFNQVNKPEKGQTQFVKQLNGQTDT